MEFEEKITAIFKLLDELNFEDDPRSGALVLTWNADEELKSADQFKDGFRIMSTGDVLGDTRLCALALDNLFTRQPDLLAGLIIMREARVKSDLVERTTIYDGKS